LPSLLTTFGQLSSWRRSNVCYRQKMGPRRPKTKSRLRKPTFDKAESTKSCSNGAVNLPAKSLLALNLTMARYALLSDGFGSHPAQHGFFEQKGCRVATLAGGASAGSCPQITSHAVVSELRTRACHARTR